MTERRLSSLQKKIISLLLASKEPVSIEKLKKLTNFKKEKVLDELKKINEFFDEIDFPAVIFQTENLFFLQLKPESGREIEEFVRLMDKGRNLSRAALETLAVIALRGPITRKEIMKIRGVAPDSSLATLLEYELIDRFEEEGKVLYRVTPEFLRSTGLKSEKELKKLLKERLSNESEGLD